LNVQHSKALQFEISKVSKGFGVFLDLRWRRIFLLGMGELGLCL